MTKIHDANRKVINSLYHREQIIKNPTLIKGGERVDFGIKLFVHIATTKGGFFSRQNRVLN